MRPRAQRWCSLQGQRSGSTVMTTTDEHARTQYPQGKFKRGEDRAREPAIPVAMTALYRMRWEQSLAEAQSAPVQR
ncbi:protein of unknown function [Candidatus Filomicrobium marinum]|uniref:Uncharacterized protein n=1 Tax=Candidatus Filomicrobium marinum TaxID=1608628 RepID=A0A0D6JK19_9HYPH|nr:protein of unknown function [Candidatus Filomicrobium marinum]CPR22334.1 protein of unknown function [Candidatus Filomicrobium marinum]